MKKTNQELWEEVLRTADTLSEIEDHQVGSLERKVASEESISEDDIPVDYIADTQILTRLLLRLKDRGADVK
jgi:hypothetical protein